MQIGRIAVVAVLLLASTPAFAMFKSSGILLAQPGSRLVHKVDVLGEEDRYNIPSHTGYFTAAGGLLTMTFGDSQSTCTGYLIAKDWILTSAHCVYDLDTGEAASRIVFDPGKTHRHDFTYPREYASEFWILKDALDLIQNDEALGAYGPTRSFIEKDLAVIRIPTLKGRTRILEYPLHLRTPDSPEKRVYMQTAGYPADKEAGTYWFASCDGMLMRDYDVFETVCDAVPGQSGSAVVQIWSPEDVAHLEHPVPNKPVLVGVISAVSKRTTMVTALTQPVIDEIHGLVGKTKAPHTSFTRMPLKRKFENRLFVNNTCSRQVTIFVQAPERVDGKVVKKLRGWDIPAGERAQLLRSTFARGEVINKPEDANRITLSREVGPYGKPEPLGPVKSVWLEEKQRRIAGYPYTFGDVWTDTRLVIACTD